MLKRLGGVVATACVGLALWAGPASAAPGDLDRSFGVRGIVSTPEAMPGGPNETTVGMGIGPRGEIFILSRGPARCFAGACQVDLRVDRYSRNGTEDPSFGANGDAVISVATGQRFGTATIAVGRDGRPVVAASAGADIVVVRLDGAGRRDPTFGSAGSVTSDFGGIEAVSSVAVAGNGTIVVGGSRLAPEGELPMLVRYESDGRLDGGFGDRGFRVMGFASGNRVEGLTLLGRGRIAAGLTACCYYSGPAVVARFAANGDLDRRFARRGWRTLRGLSSSSITTVVAAGRGRIVAIGSMAGRFGRRAFAIRFLASGRIDKSFARRGVFRGGELQWGASATAAVDPVGRTVLGAGERLLRLRSTGRPDRTFAGGSGTSGPIDRILAIGLQPSGHIVVLGSAGECIRSCSLWRVLARYVGGASGARCRGRQATIVGTRSSEGLIGTRGRDVIAALGGNDRVRGGGGNDLICGGAGDDELWGGGARDRLVGGPGGDRVHQ